MKDKQELYDLVRARIRELIAGETDLIAIVATVACELHHGFDYFDWTGFYRVVEPGLLKIGPYQGSRGCLTIPFDRGVCGAAARLRKTQIVPDVTQCPGYIACSASTRSEIVVPVLALAGDLVAVLDVDSDRLSAFDEIDRVNLEEICRMIGAVVRPTGRCDPTGPGICLSRIGGPVARPLPECHRPGERPAPGMGWMP